MSPQNKEESEVPEIDPSIKFGRFLSNPEPGDEVVITGVAGQYPESDGVHEFRDNLFNKVDMVTGDDRRWKTHHPEIPKRTGKVKNISKFDAGFFGLHYKQAESMDPNCRLLLQTVVECLFDAGVHPYELEGTKTGVFVGACFCENERTFFYERLEPGFFAVTGNERSMLANRLSYFLKLKGPSFICDTACSSSLYALEHAYRSIRSGDCDRAIVAGSNICMHPFVSLQFARLGVLSMDGKCKVFDAEGNGYVRSETISAILLQKSKEAKRVYATLVHAKTNCDGYKDSGITYPSGEMQVRLLNEFYQECGVRPCDMTFLEAHGTGTKVGDPEECAAIEEVFTKDRQEPLLIGSVKSNIGHTEPSSGLCSITKIIIAMETGIIPPNINFKTPRKGMKGLEDGRMQVVTEKTPLPDKRGLIGINSFGFGGGNCHVLLKWNTKEKKNGGRSTDELPRLVCVSGRTKEAVKTLLDDVLENHCDTEHMRLLQEIFKHKTKGHFYRGFSVLAKGKELLRSTSYFAENSPVYVAFTEVADARIINLLNNELFANTLKEINGILKPSGIDIYNTLSNVNTITTSDKILASVAIQVGIFSIFKQLNIVPAGFLGLNLGKLMCAYADEALTLKQLIQVSVVIATTAKDIPAADMAYIVYIPESKLKQILPRGVHIMSTNSDSSTLIFGDLGNINNFVNDLTSKGVECSEVGPVINFLDEAFVKNKKKIVQQLSSILSNPKELSSKYLPSNSKVVVSAEGIFNSLISITCFKGLSKIIPSNSVVLEIGNNIFQDVLYSAVPQVEYLALKNDFVGLVQGLGRLYELGYQPSIQKLYPEVQFPVSRGTPSISPKIKWNHERDWWVTKYDTDSQFQIGEKTFKVVIKDPTYSFLSGHVIDGRNLFPATGYLQLAWETLAQITGFMKSDMKVIFENCRFKRACTVPKDDRRVEFTVMVQRGSGNFEILEGGSLVASGTIRLVKGNEKLPNAVMPLPQEVPEDESRSMSNKDIYKELRVRGYNYSGLFRGLQYVDSSCQVGKLKWEANWAAFMDSMLQIKILQEDTRLLYVPTFIERVTVDAKKHVELATANEDQTLPLYCNRENGVIRSGAIEISGLNASSIPRRKLRGTPVLEKYEFVPNVCKLSTHQSVRTNVQIGLENTFGIRVKVVELIDEESMNDLEPLAATILEVLGDVPLIQPDITVLSKDPLEITGVKVEDKKLLTETECMVVVASKLLQRTAVLKVALGSLKENGYIISREPIEFDYSSVSIDEISILTVHITDNEQMILLKKRTEYKEPIVIKATTLNKEFKWLTELQTAVKSDSNVLIYVQDEPLNGILGLVNCIRREPGGHNVKCMFIVDRAPAFDPKLPFYKEQLKNNAAISVFKNGCWGTYRHLLLEDVEDVEVEHSFVNSLVRGDLSTLRWIQGPLTRQSRLGPGTERVHIYYSSLNFRDVMVASGRINADIITRDRRTQECVQGFEYSGRTEDGRRVMGMAESAAMASMVAVDSSLLWEVPDSWSLEEAATVPVVYGTSLYALYKKARVKRGDIVLIHSGTGGVGQACISLCLFFGCRVFTTVGTPEKREFIKKRFPQLSDKHIANSRDTTFEQHIMRETNGRGVDVVVNSLAEEKLLASVRCLAPRGRFVEIGKFDLGQNNPLNLKFLAKEASFHGLMLDAMFTSPYRFELKELMDEAIRAGAVTPLSRTVFKSNEVEAAFRHMTTGKHMGKVLIQIRKEEREKKCLPQPALFKSIPRYFCSDTYSYIICGGLGGFGLELADWLILRGARFLVLNSRNGLRTGYQQYRLNVWKSYGCTVHISTQDITTKQGCEHVINEANNLAPVRALFNLAVVLKDALLENQSEESFELSFAPKAYATEYLDEVTRKLCPELNDFVIFSSVSSGRGNTGQSNYGMANSVMERICEKRRGEGYPALAIEWGAVGDVGLVAEMQEKDTELVISGTLQQRISSCLSVLDTLLRQNQAAVVSSMVVAEKRAGAGNADNIVDAVANILGVKDLKTVSMHATLAEMGMDSMTAVEIKQTLEREFEVFLTAQDIKTMTFARLQEIQAEKDLEKEGGVKKEKPLYGMDMIVRIVGDPVNANIPVLKMKNKSEEPLTKKVILIPGVEGVVNILENLASRIEAQTVGVQFCNDTQKDTIEEMSHVIFPHVENQLSKDEPFNIVSYSYGALIALEVVRLLEEKGYSGTLFCIDGAPAYIQELTTVLEASSEDKFQTGIIMHMMALQLSYDTVHKHTEALFKCNSLEERITLAQKIVGPNEKYSPEQIRTGTISFYKRIKALVQYSPKFKIKSQVKLFKAKQVSIQIPQNDYNLSELCENVDVRVFSGNHVTVLDNSDVAKAINRHLIGTTEEEEPEVTEENGKTDEGNTENSTETSEDVAPPLPPKSASVIKKHISNGEINKSEIKARLPHQTNGEITVNGI